MATKGRKPKDPAEKARKPPTRQRRNYSAEEKGETKAVLDAEGGSVKAASRVTGVPESTVRGIRDDETPEVEKAAEIAKGELADRLEALAQRCLDLIPAKLPKASARELAGVIIVAVDKMQLLRGQPTAITEPMSDEDRARRAAEILERGKGRLK